MNVNIQDLHESAMAFQTVVNSIKQNPSDSKNRSYVHISDGKATVETSEIWQSSLVDIIEFAEAVLQNKNASSEDKKKIADCVYYLGTTTEDAGMGPNFNIEALTSSGANPTKKAWNAFIQKRFQS